MSRAWLLVVLAVAGCPSSSGGSDGGGSGDDLAVGNADDMATSGGASPDLAPAANTGTITVTSATSAMDKSLTAYATFMMGVLPPSPCVLTFTAHCQAADCTIPSADAGSPPVTYSLVSGGTVTVAGGAMPLTMTPTSGGYYAPVPSSAQALFSGGETLTLANSGAVAPASSMTVVAPSPSTITTPAAATSYTITRSNGFALAWSGGGPGDLTFTIQSGFPSAQPGSKYGSVTCTFPVADGQATVPPSALAALPAGSAFFQLTVSHTVSTTVGDWLMNAVAVTYPVTPAGASFASGQATIN